MANMANIDVGPLTVHLGGVPSADAGEIVTAALNENLQVSAAPGNVTVQFPAGSGVQLIAALKFLNDVGNATIRVAVLNAFGAAEVPPDASTTA